MTRTTTGIVLAGGRSRRFGADKLEATLEGRPLLHHAVERLAKVCDEVLVVAAPGDEPLVPPGARLVHDAEPHRGPLAGLAAGLAAASSPLAVVVGGDMPTLSAAMLRELRDDAHETGASAVALAEDDVVRPLPCVVRREILEVALRLLSEGEGGLLALLRAVGVRAVPEDVWRALDPDAATLRDVDRPADLES